MRMIQQPRTRFLGLEVHRGTIAVALAEETGPATSHSTIANEPAAVWRLAHRLGGPEVRLIAAYEADRPAARCTVSWPASAWSAWSWRHR